MLGRLLEISVSTRDPLQELQFYLGLGFRELTVGDVWSHPYAVVSDGDICIGLHSYEFDSPALTFVQADLDQWSAAYRVQQIELAFAKLSPDEFNEIGFVDPGGQMVTVLESRTFSPAPFDEHGLSRLGRFETLELPCRDSAASTAFWSRLGRIADSGLVESAGLSVTIDDAPALTCRYRGDVIELAQFAARAGVRNLTVSADEREALIKPAAGPQFIVAQN